MPKNSNVQSATNFGNEKIIVIVSRKQFVFPGGYYQPSKTLFDDLEEVCIATEKQQRIYDKFAVFDFEALLQPLTQIYL